MKWWRPAARPLEQDLIEPYNCLKMKRIILCCLLVVFAGCRKKHEALYGNVSVSGKVTDIVSGAPLPNAIVYLYAVRDQFNGIGYIPIATDIVLVDTADASGNYAMSIVAKGEYEFEFGADPNSPYYVNSGYTVGYNHQRIKEVGDHTINQACHRSAYAKVALTNVAPIDTPYFISLSCYDNLVLYNYYKDTLVYLKLVGRSDYPNSIRFNKNNQEDNTYQKTVGPWDTIPMQFNY